MVKGRGEISDQALWWKASENYAFILRIFHEINHLNVRRDCNSLVYKLRSQQKRVGHKLRLKSAIKFPNNINRMSLPTGLGTINYPSVQRDLSVESVVWSVMITFLGAPRRFCDTYIRRRLFLAFIVTVKPTGEYSIHGQDTATPDWVFVAIRVVSHERSVSVTNAVNGVTRVVIGISVWVSLRRFRGRVSDGVVQRGRKVERGHLR